MRTLALLLVVLAVAATPVCLAGHHPYEGLRFAFVESRVPVEPGDQVVAMLRLENVHENGTELELWHAPREDDVVVNVTLPPQVWLEPHSSLDVNVSMEVRHDARGGYHNVGFRVKGPGQLYRPAVWPPMDDEPVVTLTLDVQRDVIPPEISDVHVTLEPWAVHVQPGQPIRVPVSIENGRNESADLSLFHAPTTGDAAWLSERSRFALEPHGSAAGSLSVEVLPQAPEGRHYLHLVLYDERRDRASSFALVVYVHNGTVPTRNLTVPVVARTHFDIEGRVMEPSRVEVELLNPTQQVRKVELVSNASAEWDMEGPGVVEVPPGGARVQLLLSPRSHVREEARGDILLIEDNQAVARLHVRVAMASHAPASFAQEFPSEDARVLTGTGLVPGQRLVGAAAAGVGAVALGVAMLHRRWPLAFGALYTRIRPSRVLHSGRRRRILEEVRAHPGVHAAELQRRVGLANGAFSHHVRQLEAAGVLKTIRDGAARRVFPREEPSRSSTPTIRERVLIRLREQGPARASDLARELQCSRQAVHQQLHRLLQEGAVAVVLQRGQLVISLAGG